MRENANFHKYPGGAKKFLYTGSKKEGSDDEQWTFAPKDSATKTGKAVDLNDVWSIQKNVSLGGVAPRSTDRLTHNASKGFYSRHGGMKDSTKNGVSQPSERKDVPQWAAARGSSFSYSYNSGHKFNINNDDANSQASSQVSRGYHSNPSPRPRHFNGSTWQADENDF